MTRKTNSSGSAITDVVPAYGRGARLPKNPDGTHRKAIRRADLYIARNLPRYLALLEELASGVVVMEEKEGRDGTTKRRIYTAPPDREALKFLVERGLGKSPQRVELTGKEAGPMEFVAWEAGKTSDELKGEIVDAEVKVLDGETTL